MVELDLFDDISYEDGTWRASDDMRVPNTLSKYSKLGKAIEETKIKTENEIKASNIVEALNIKDNITFKNKIAQHLVLKKEEKPSTFKTKAIISYELSKNADEFKEIAGEIIESYNKQHTLPFTKENK